MQLHHHSNWQNIHEYWFKDLSLDKTYLKERGQLWFGKNPEVDRYMREQFLPLLKDFSAGRRFSEWKSNPQSYVSLIVLLDQFSRNIFRDSDQMYAYDHAALNLALEGLKKNIDQALHPLEKVFFYLPLEHSENLNMQRLSLKMFKQLMDKDKTFTEHYIYAVKHYDIIAQFGRFPHRNKILNRTSSPEEIEFLKQPGSSF
ncbi:DUF924 domain-containing protein [bacterium]|nr:DUF924 domain-containing protein [bacterium]